MIASDQPVCFPDTVAVAVSSREDGTMLDRTAAERHSPEVVERRRRFCESAQIPYERCVYQIISYEPGVTYDTIVRVDEPSSSGVRADVLYCDKPEVGLFLPVADCVATVLYDPTVPAIALLHLGRHASIAKTMSKTVKYFVSRGSDPANIIMWMAPSVHQDDYIMQYFDHADDPDWKPYCTPAVGGIALNIAGFNCALAEKEGIKPINIHRSPANTATDSHYFSHSQGDAAGRFAVVAMMRKPQ